MPRKKVDSSKSKYDAKAFGARLRECRLEKGFSIQKLANEVGVLRNYISQLDRGDRAPSFDVLLTLIRVLEIDANTLLRDYFCVQIQTDVRAQLIAQILVTLSTNQQEHILNMITMEATFLNDKKENV